MSIPISRPTPQMREPQKFSAFRENVSTNWENHQVSIVTSAALGLAIGAISIVFATTLLTGGAAMILFAVGGMAIVAGLGISTYFTIKPPPKGLDQYRTENITPKVPSINTKKKTSEIPSEKSKTEKELERELRKDSDSEKVRQAKTPSKEGAEEETNSSGIKHPKVSKVSVDCPFEVASTDQQSKRSLLLSNNSQVQNLYSLERSNGEKNGILHSTPHPSRLHPALSSQSFSLVNKHFLELIGKDFDPSQTQGNSFYAYEILEHVVKWQQNSSAL